MQSTSERWLERLVEAWPPKKKKDQPHPSKRPLQYYIPDAEAARAARDYTRFNDIVCRARFSCAHVVATLSCRIARHDGGGDQYDKKAMVKFKDMSASVEDAWCLSLAFLACIGVSNPL